MVKCNETQEHKLDLLLYVSTTILSHSFEYEENSGKLIQNERQMDGLTYRVFFIKAQAKNVVYSVSDSTLPLHMIRHYVHFIAKCGGAPA
jgi:hypothetical protein